MSNPLKLINDLAGMFKNAFNSDADKFTRVGGTLVAFSDGELSDEDEDKVAAIIAAGSPIMRRLCQDPPPRQRVDMFTASLIVQRINDNCYIIIGDKKEVERNTPLI